LAQNPNDFIGTLNNSRDQTQLWIYAYSSWLFNRLITDKSMEGELRERMPQLLHSDPAERAIYEPYLRADGVEDFVAALRPFKYIHFAERYQETIIYPEVIDYKILPKKVVINFFLPKGAYATTFLAHLFVLHQYRPIPSWVDKEEIDPKAILGQGNIQEIKNIFRSYWQNKKEEII